MSSTNSPALIVDEGAIELPENFQWGKQWVALRMWKEQRDDGEYLFAACLRKYGPNDFGNKTKDHIYIGRKVKWTRGKITDTDPDSPTFTKRIDEKAEEVIEKVFNEKTGNWDEIKIPVNATKTYDYLHKADNDDMVKLYKSLVGPTPRSGKTHFTFIWGYGSEFREVKTAKEFFGHSVKEMQEWEESKLQTEAFKTPKENTK